MSTINNSELIQFHHIRKQTAPLPNRKYVGRADVLSLLLPELNGKSVFQTFNEQYIDNLDDTMKAETLQLLLKLQPLFEQVYSLNTIDCELVSNGNSVLIHGTDNRCKELTRLINQHKQCVSIIDWLQPNYVGLIHSLEMLNFAKLYTTNQASAFQQYQHFNQINNGLRCKLVYRAGSLTIAWQSPVQRFLLRES